MSVLTSTNEKEIMITCNCGCGEGVAFNFECWEGIPEVVVSIVGHDFTHENISKLGRRICRAWNGITGKDKHLTDFYVSRKELQEFMAHINDFLYKEILPEEYSEDGWFVCPNCNNEQQFRFDNNHTFCTNCGAHIDDSLWRPQED